jgi:hypothetical protein
MHAVDKKVISGKGGKNQFFYITTDPSSVCPGLFWKNQKSKTKNVEIKALPGISRTSDHHHWIPNPILTKKRSQGSPLIVPLFFKLRLKISPPEKKGII